MVLDIIDYIGDKLLAANPYIEAFAANCIKLKKGQIVNFVGEEKQNFGPSDIIGIASYARITSGITYTDNPKKMFSDSPAVKGSMDFRIVLFQIGRTPKLHPVKAENKLWADLYRMNFTTYTGVEEEIKVSVKSSALDFSEAFRVEVGKDYTIPTDSVIIALNCNLAWLANPEDCAENCNVFVDPSKC